MEVSYKQATKILGKNQSVSNRFWVKDFTSALNNNGKLYYSKHVKQKIRRYIYQEVTIVLIRRSKLYPAGHYLVRHQNMWMDPWINLAQCKDINKAKSGYRKRLPGKPMYALLPC